VSAAATSAEPAPSTSAPPSPSFWARKPVAVTGGAGFLGRATVRLLESLGAGVRVVRSAEHDLRDPAACRDALDGADVVIHLAAHAGGIGFHRRNPGPAAYDNLMMGSNVFEAARERGVAKLVAACSACAYPQSSPIPFREDDIWLGYPDPSTAPYGMAKKMMLVLSDAYRRQYGLDSCAPVLVNLYGPGDNYDPEHSHVVAAMIRKYVEAERDGRERVVLWGTGEPTREFLYVDDGARALLLAAERYDSSEPVNIGTGEETRIRDLAERVATLAGYEGETVWDSERPDGQRRRFLDVSRARERIGFEAEVGLEDGLRRAIESFRELFTHAR
jgi:GDP-L-fucose synthase